MILVEASAHKWKQVHPNEKDRFIQSFVFTWVYLSSFVFICVLLGAFEFICVHLLKQLTTPRPWTSQ
jgi:hypothetical protein